MAELAASAAVNPVAENTINAIGRQFGYLWNYRKNMDNLEKQVTALESKIIDRDRSVNVEIRNAKETSKHVKNWLSEARSISGQARSFIDEHIKRGELRCLVGRCPNPVSRYQFGRKACKIEKDVADSITKEVQIREVSFPLLGFFTFDSRKSILEDIMKALQTEPKSMVGLYGFGGMGKTTLAKQVASRAEEGKLFEEIVFASVTQKVDVKEIQGQFASMLDLKLEESTAAERANRVRQRLKGKKVLVILDDLWKELDLKEVGVDFGAEHMGCKILLTSRFRHVLISMGTGEDFNLGALDDEEAWRLFEEKVGGSVLKNSGFHNIGKKVAKKCQGLPVLIVTVAASLSTRPQLPTWNDALNQLENMNHKEMHDIVNSAIEAISINHLEKTHKNLFLLCGVLGGDASIEEVLQYSLGLGWDLFDNPTQTVTIQKARDRLHALILDLKESCLLLDDVDSKKSIKMHDVVRDVAISIGSKDLNMLSIGEYGDELNIWRKDEHRIAMVLRGCPKLSCLPQLLECPSLELFVISGLSWDSSPSVPESFFEKTDKLKVLGISLLSFTTLPPSLSFLKNLQTLRVNDCYSLRDISIVGDLKKLQILSFAGYTDIEELPSGIGQLSDLRSLDVRGCRYLKVIPAGLIEGLTRLEELYVSRYFNRWEAEVCNNGSVKINASFQELKHLRKLCSLEITVGDLPENLYFEKLESYEIIVGASRIYRQVLPVYHAEMADIWEWLDKMEVARKIVWLGKLKGINHLQSAVKMLFKSTECLLLGQLSGIKNVLPALDGDGFPNLKHLRIEKDSEIQYVVNVEDTQPMAAFPSLESLHLMGLWKLQKISNGPLMEESFCNLTSVKVQHCNELKSLFSFSMAIGLSRLQEIKVSDCNALEGIVAKKNIKDDGVQINDGVREEIVEFAQLRKLTLSGLPKLKNFVSNGEIQNKRQKSLQESEIHTEEDADEGELKSSLPFFTKVSFFKLEKLVLSEIPNLTEIWSHRFQEISLCNLTTMKVGHCNVLKSLFSFSMATGLSRLQEMEVSDCDALEAIVTEKNVNDDGVNDGVREEIVEFAQLRKLTLSGLPKLKNFISNGEIQNKRQKSLQESEIHTEEDDDEGELKSSLPFFTKVSFPRLEKLELSGISSFKYLLTPSVVADRRNLSILDFLSFPPKEGDDKFEKVMSNSKYMSIRSTDLEKIRDLYCHFPPHLFSSLERLTIVGSGVFPSEFLGIIHNQLKRFAIYNCSFQEIFPYEREFTNHSIDHTLFLPQLKWLSLEKLPQLKYICTHDKKKSLILNILGRIKYLQVEECPRLTNLVQPSTTRNLKQLWRLTISGCEMMEKIIGDDDDDDDGDDEESSRDDNEIIFPNLWTLRLSKLPMLTNFCSSLNYTFNFPELRNVEVRECPNMKTFCVGITTTPNLKKVEYEHDQERWEGDLNTTVQKVFAEMEAKRLGISLPSTLSSNHVEAKALALENSSEELTEPIPTVVQIRQNQEKEPEVYENSIETETFKAIVPYTREKGKGKDPEVSEEVMEHSNPSTHSYTAREQTVAGSVASSSKSSSHSEEFHERPIPSTSSSSNNQEAEVHDQTAEPTKEPQICKHVIDEISEEGTFTENAIEPRIATEISEDGAEKSVKLDVRELAPLLPSTNYIEAAAQAPKNLAKAQNDATNVDKMADTFETGSQASSEETNPPAQTSLSHSTELEVRGSTSTVESEATDPKKGSEIDEEVLQGVKLPDISDKALPSQLHPPISNTLQATSQQKDFKELRVTKHFIPLMSKVLEILQTRPLNRMRPEHVKFMEDASRELSHMNFPMDWLCPYLVKANNCLSVVERTNAISKVELKIAEVESQLQALQESKRSLEETKKAMEEENKVIAFSMVLDKPLYEE